ncbi:MAG: hypothetical protein LBE20_03270 [Deltaproteobacteria bacterium]|jgi:hypothetical protein|nr:hypothetical protein [Deltaproteobacteria bacterium]
MNYSKLEAIAKLLNFLPQLENCAEKVFNKRSFIQRHTRLSRQTKRFLERIARHLTTNLEVKAQFELLPEQLNPEERLPMFFKTGCVSMQFRVDQETAMLFFPYEAIYEIAILVAGQKNQRLLTHPSNEELIAVSYYIAKLLCDNQVFTEKIIYLISVNLHPASEVDENTEKLKNLLLSKLEQGKCFLECFKLALNQQNYWLLAFVSDKLGENLLEAAKFEIPKNYLFNCLTQQKLDCSLNFELYKTKLLIFNNLKIGQKFIFPLTELSQIPTKLKGTNWGLNVKFIENKSLNKLFISSIGGLC